MNNVKFPCADQVKYLGLHLDRKLTRHHHIFTKRKQLGLTLTKMYWLLGRSSRLSLPNKLLLYKTIHKPIWTYGIQLWGTASTSNIEILERFQSKALSIIVDAPWYVLNNHIRRDLQLTSVKGEIRRYSSQYSARLNSHPNDQIVTLMELPGNRRLWRHLPNDLSNRFLVLIVVVVILVFKSYSQKPQQALNLLVTEERCWALFYMSMYTFIHNLLKVLVQIANKMGFKKKGKKKRRRMRAWNHRSTLYCRRQQLQVSNYYEMFTYISMCKGQNAAHVLPCAWNCTDALLGNP
jgi:hypothetical protein